MRGADAYNEALFSTVKLEEFVPQTHPLRPIRKWLNEALAHMDAKFSAMYEADVKGGRPSIAPEKLMRAMLLQVLYSVRSERQLVEQISYNLLFRWFVGLSIEDTVWNHSVFSKNRDRLIEFDAVTDLFNATVEMADKRGLLSGEHFSVDGTLIHAWASHKSVRRKDGSEFAVEISLSPLQTETGLLVSGAIRDVSQRRRAERGAAHAEQHDGVLVDRGCERCEALGLLLDLAWHLEPAEAVRDLGGVRLPEGVIATPDALDRPLPSESLDLGMDPALQLPEELALLAARLPQLRQLLLDALFPFPQPVHRLIEIVLRGRLDSQLFGQGGGVPLACCGQLRTGVNQPFNDHRHDQVALSAALSCDNFNQSELADHR